MSEERSGLHPTAYECPEGQEYQPLIRQDDLPEMTLRAVLSGIILGVIFGAANAYLGLMAGLTISTSIPVAVLTVVVFRTLGSLKSNNTLLEANMSQTIGSASSSVASGTIFTIPALFIWGVNPELLQLTLLAMCGATLGILFMIPLRRFLIKREHGKLPYPEGLACAEVLVASKQGGSHASNVFYGLGVGFLFKALTDGFQLIGKSFEGSLSSVFQGGLGKISAAVKVSPALMGVGYILGPRIASVMLGGAALSTFLLIPGIAFWAGDAIFYPGTESVSSMSASEIWNTYIRYIGAGAVAAAGIWTLIRSIPVMLESFKLGVSQMETGDTPKQIPRTDRDLGFKWVAIGVGIVALVLIFVPKVLGFLDTVWIKSIAAVLVVIFAFFFVTVASRIVGIVGVTSNPVSGMTIATLLLTSLIFGLMGWTDLPGKATALMVGTCVCIAASISGDTSQDLKTGFLLGATPRRQQLGEILGALTSATFIILTIQALHSSVGIGSKELPAPQGKLMQLVIDGVIDKNLPWELIFIGVGLTAIIIALKLPALAFAVGVYLPLSTMAPIFLGGLLRYFLTRNKEKAVADERREKGVLFASGLVGGEGLMGVGLALGVLVNEGQKITGVSKGWPAWTLQIGALIGVGVILLLIAKAATRPSTTEQSEA